MVKAHVKKNDQVEVISGKDRGKRGRVLQVAPAKKMVLVEGINLVKRHTKPNPQRNIKGGIAQKEAFIHLSNVLAIDPKTDKATRTGWDVHKNGDRTRVARPSGAALKS